MKSGRSVLVFLAICIVVLLFSASTEVPYSVIYDSGTATYLKEYTPSSAFEQFVDNNISDVDGLGSLGTHSNFVNQQSGPDAIYDQLTEENTNPITTNVEDDYDSYTGDVDSSPDVGLETNPTNAQGSSLDSQYMTLQEVDVGSPYQSAWLDTDQYDGLVELSMTNVGASPYLGVQDYPTNYVTTKAPGSQGGWWGFPNTTLTGDLTVNVSIYCWNLDGDNNDGFDVYYDTSGGAGSLLGRVAQHTALQYDVLQISGTLTQTQVNSLRIMLVFYKSGGTNNVYADHLQIGVSSPKVTNYDADFEYSWNSVDYDESHEEVCINIGTIGGTESLNVSYWDGIGWIQLGEITSSGWTNLTAIGLTSISYSIRIRSAETTNDAVQESWTIDLITLHTWTDQTYNYELDLEVQWTTASFDNNNELLCIYAGNTDTENLIIDVWDGVGWTNVLPDLQANSWNNISVKTWLTSSTFTIRFKGGLDIGDSAPSQWNIDATLLRTWNNIPSIDAQPEVSNIDDESFMYAKVRDYFITANVSDQDGYADIENVRLSLYSNDRLSLYWAVEYNEDADLFSEHEDTSDYIALDVFSSSVLKLGNDLDLTFHIAIEWNHPDISGTDVECIVIDSKLENSTDWYEVDWNIETRLNITGISTDDNLGTIYRGDLNGQLFTSGTVTYYGSTLSPPTDEVDVWVSASDYGENIGPWSDTTLESGFFNVTCFADDEIGLDTFTIKVVEEGLGFGSSDLLYSSIVDTYIADRIEFYASGVDDSRITIDAIGVTSWSARYQYDSLSITSGLSAALNGSKILSWNGSHWIFQETKSNVQAIGYSIASAFEDTHGLNSWIQTTSNTTVIWDRIRILGTTTQDGRIDYGSSADIRVLAELEYDGHPLGIDDILYMNDTLMTWVGPYFQLQPQFLQVGSWIFFVNASGAEELTYGISAIFLDGNQIDQIWDRILILTTTATDGRIDYGTSTTINVTAQLEFDGTLLGSGDTLYMNDTAMTWATDHFYLQTGAFSMVGILNYFVNATGANETTFGISVVQSDPVRSSVIWDRILIMSTTSQDARIDLGAFADLRVTALLEYDGHSLSLGDTIYMNNTAMTWVDPYFGLQPQFLQVGLWRFYVNSTGALETTFQITVVNVAGFYIDQIWDRIVILTTTTQDARIDFGTSADIRVTARLEFDNHPFGSADTLYMNGTSMTWVSTYFRLQPQFSMVGSWVFFVNSSNAYETTYGISIVYLDGNSVNQIWDRIEFYQSGVVDNRINVDDNGFVYWNARYGYDGLEITGVILTALLNGSKALAWNSTSLRWEFSESKNMVQLVGYMIASASETTYGLSSWIQTASNQSIIWDEIEFYSSGVEDERIDINTAGTTWWRARYAYDNVEISSGLNAELNGTKALSWNGISSWWEYLESLSVVQSMGYHLVSAFESLYGLTRFNQIAANTSIIWDKVTVQSTSTNIDHLDVGSTAQIQVTLWLEFDQTFLGSGDTVVVNGTAMTWDEGNSQFTLDVAFAAVGKWTFFVNSSLETTHGISELDLNTLSVDVIWDRILIISISVDDSRVNVGDTVELNVTAKLEYLGSGNHYLGSEDALYMNGVAMIWSIPNDCFVYSTSKSSVGLWKFFVNSSNAYEATYGITVVNLDSNIADVIWDRLVIDIQADVEFTLNDQQVNFTLGVYFDYDNVPCTTYEIMIARNNTDWFVFTYLNRTKFNDTNSDLVYVYNASTVLSETLYDITLFITNVEAVNWTEYIPIVPINEAPPNLLNPDDSDNMYARLRYYMITSNVSDPNGFQDIRLVSLLLFSDDRGTNYWTVTFFTTNSSFSINNGTSYITLGPCTFEQGDTWLNITWYIKISWNHPVLVDVDTKQFVSNTFTTATDWYESNWDIETRLDYLSLPSLSDSRGDVDTNNLVASGELIYYSSTLYPLANETDFWIIHDGSGSWSGEVDGFGFLSITGIGSSSLVRVNTYTFKIVAQGAGPTGTDLFYDVSPTDTFITDRIEFYLSGVNDGRIDAGATGTTYWAARYDYDDVVISTDLSSFLTGSKLLSWNGTYWVYSEARAGVELHQYGIILATETKYGLTAWTQIVSNTSIIWDRILITSTTVDDARVNINSNVEFYITAQLEYDGHLLESLDTLYMDGIQMAWDSVYLRFELVRSQVSVGSWRYFVNTSNGLESTYGITVVNQNGLFQDVIWDRISVQMTLADDNRVNVNDLVQVRVTLMLDYDNTYLGSGDTVVLADQAMSWDAGNSWFELDVSKANVGLWTYFVNSSTMIAHGITELFPNGMQVDVIWDRIRILTTSAADDRIDYGSSTTISVTAELEYDGHLLSGGDVLYLNDTQMVWSTDHFELVTGSYSMVGLLTYFVNSSNALELNYGITLVNPNNQDTGVIWDRIRIISTTTQDDRIDYGLAADIRVNAILEYDSHPLGSGDILYMDDSLTSWVSSYFQYQPIRNEVGSWRYFVNASNALEGTYEISVVNLDGKIIDQIWDRILILTTTTQDGRIDYNTQADIRVTVQLEFDGHMLGVNDALFMNNTPMTWTGSYFQLQPQFGQVGKWMFFVNSSNAFENTYGISYINLAGNNVEQIWDRIQISTTSADDSRVGIDTVVIISVTAQLEYDGHVLSGSDTLYLDDTQLNWNTDHFEYQTSKSSVGQWRYYVNSTLANEATYGITSLNPSIIWADIIWDRILILTTNALDDHIDYGSSATIAVTAVLEFDNHPLGAADTLYMDNTGMTWNIDHFEYISSKSEIGLWRYFVNSSSALENTYGITLLNVNSRYQDVIWDRIEFYQSGVVDGRIDVNSIGETWWRARYQYDGVEIDNTKGFFASLNGSKSIAWDGLAARWRYQESSASVQSIGYSIVSASESVHGLSQWVLSTSNTTIIWDQIIVVSYSADDSRININTASSCHVTLIFDFDDSFVIDGSISINGLSAIYSGSNGVWNFGESRSTAQLVTYNSVAASINVHGITSVNQNSQTLAIIWDSLTITITVSDSRIDVGTIASIVPTAVYDYDSSGYDGTLQLNDTIIQQASAGYRGYTVTSASGDSHGITAIRLNMEVGCIWDSLIVSIAVVDSRINVNDTASISATAVYAFDSTPYDGTLSLNDTSFQQVTVGDKAYTVQSASGDTYGITVISSNSVKVVIWDRLRVLSYSVTDLRCDLGSIQEITALIIREYDSVLFTGAMGTVFLNGSAMAWDSIDLVWTQLRTSSLVRRLTFRVNAVTDTQYGISAINTPSGPSIIWDALSISITVTDNRINIGDTASINPDAIYLYDGATYDGTLLLNDTVFIYGTAQQHWFTADSAVGDDTYGITAIEINEEVYCIWDSLTILITGPVDQRIDVNTNASGIIVSATYDFDNTVYDGSLVLNNTVFTYDPAQKQGYKVQFASGDDSYGITAIRQNAETYCIWDSLSITITDPFDQRINIGENATGIVVSATYDFDGLNYGGTFVLNDTQFLYSTVGKRGYKVLTANGDDTYGIAAISTSDDTFCIWDQLRIDILVDGASLYNGQQANFTLTIRYDYDFTFCTTFEVVISRNETIWRAFTDSNKSLFNDVNSDVVYYYNASLVSYETLYGITAFFTTTQKVTWSEAPNQVPSNDTDFLSMLENPDDSDNMYAMYRFYVINTNVSDGNGFDMIEYVEVSLYDNFRSQIVWTVRYSVATDTFTIQQGLGSIILASWSSAVGVGNRLEIKWVIKITWDHLDLSDTDIRQFVTDGIDTDEDFYEVNWDVETRLDYSSVPSLSDDRGDVSTANLVATGSVIYLGSTHSPLANETDVWVLHDISGTWSGNLVTDSFSISSVGSFASVRLNTYTFKIVVEGTGAGGTDLYYSTSLTDTFITDRIEVYQAGVVDSRLNTDIDCEVWWRARYEYDSVAIQGGLTIDLNGSRTLIWDAGDLYWRWQETSSSPTSAGFDVVSASESTYGLSALSVTTSVQRVIWDALIITITDPIDQRINIGENATGIVVSAIYAYDGAAFDGTLTLNNTVFSYAIAQKQNYTVQSVSGDTYGITAIQSNDITWCIWDSLTITITDPTDQRQNVNTNATGIFASAIYDYDGSTFDGTLILNNTVFSYATAQRQDYTVQSVSGGDHGITAISSNDVTYYIWDSLTITITDPSDQRINVNTAATGIVASAVYDYDGAAFDGTLGLNNTQLIYATAQIQWYTVASASSDSHGISTINTNDVTWCIWDQIVVLSYQASDPRDNVGDYIWVDVNLQYDYDDTPVIDGSVTINGFIFQHYVAGVWRLNRTESVVSSITFDSVSCTDNIHGIQSVNQNSQSQLVIWDELIITISIIDRRIDVGSTALIQVSAVYQYDGQSFDGILTLNDTVNVHNMVGRWAYTVVSAIGDSYGISLIGTNDEDYVIWDRVRILSYWNDEADGRTNVGVKQQVYVTADYEYDSSVFQGAQHKIFMNGSEMTWNGALLRWNHSFVYSTPVGYVFQVSVVSDPLYGLTVIGEQMSPVSIIWDKLNVVIEANAAIAYFGDIVSFTITATRQYDNSRVNILTVETSRNGTSPVLNNFTDTWNGPVDTHLQYLVVNAIDGVYGITEFDTMMIEVFWTDAPIVKVDDAYTSDDGRVRGRVNIGTVISVYFHCVWLENWSNVESGLLYVNSVPYSINETGWVVLTDSSSDVNLRNWIVTGVDANGVILFEEPDVNPEMIWDAIAIRKMDVLDARINVGDLATIIVEAEYMYDNLTYAGTLSLNNTIFRYFTVGRRGYTVFSAYDDDYGISVIKVNNETSVIWDGLIINLSVEHERVGLDTSITVNGSAIYAFDGAVFDGELPLNDPIFVQSSVGMRMYTVREEFISGGIHGIKAVISNDEVYVIWDTLEVYWSQKERDRCDVDGSVQVRFKVRYSFDGLPYTDLNGTLWINGEEAIFDSVNQYWFTSVTHNQTGSFNYQVDMIDDHTTGVDKLRYVENSNVTAIFDSVYVLLAGVRNSERDASAPDTFDATVGSNIIVYFQLRYRSDNTDINNPTTTVKINGKQATFNINTQRWEATFAESVPGNITYRIDIFEDEYGLTQVDHGIKIPRVIWYIAPIPQEILYAVLVVVSGSALVLFAARIRKRVTKLELALTPEELLSLEDVGISPEMREQMVTQLEWLRDLSEEIPFFGTDILRVLNEELTKAKQMYTRAFELEPPTEAAGMRLKEMLLERIDSVLQAIEKEMERR
ncbi:MAG: hypothetical protein ACFFCX_08290 [Candidatus Sifarchaeia archaeon]